MLINVPKLKNPDIPLGNLYFRHIRGFPVKVYTGILTMLTPAERLHLYNLSANLTPNNQIVEIGTYAGGSTYFLGKGAEISRGKVTSIDPFASMPDRQLAEDDRSSFIKYFEFKPTLHSVRQSLNRAGINGQVELIEAFGENVAATWGKPLDMLWIDGNHHHARKDYDAWERHLKPNAVVAFHDTGYPLRGKPKVTEDVRQLLQEIPYSNLQVVDSITSFRIGRGH